MSGPCYCEECLARGHRRSTPWRRLLYTIVQDLTDVKNVKATSAIAALREVKLRSGARVKVFIPAIVHQRRLKP